MRISKVHRARLVAISPTGWVNLMLSAQTHTADFAVGDWVLVHPEDNSVQRLLVRKTLISRQRGEGRPNQLAAANVDTLFIVTSCNADFNSARLERYLAMANESGTNSVIILTKADTVADTRKYEEKAALLQRELPVVVLDARSPDCATALVAWCGPGQTVVLVGSSGVGKSTLVNALIGGSASQLTGDMREHDAKGRHTTTSRSLHSIERGGWVIDTPGIRTLNVSEVSYGIDMLFAEITELAPLCRFRNCTHSHEPGCAVQAAVNAGTVDPERLIRWRKLQVENASNISAPGHSRGGGGKPNRKNR